MDAHEYLKRPYARLVVPDADGSYFAEIVEFPGCFTTGKNATEALENLESVAVDWINTTVAEGQDIPDPMDANEFSGKLVLRMTKGLHKRAALWAEREGVSLNQFITTCLAEAVGERARPGFVVAQPALHAVANMTLQLVPMGGMFFNSTLPHTQPLTGHHQLGTGGGATVVGFPTNPSWHQPQREQQHG